MVLGIFNHPLMFAAVAIAAIGVIIYEIVSDENRNRHRNGRRPPPPGPDDHRRRPPRPPPPGPDDHRRRPPDSPPPGPHPKLPPSPLNSDDRNSHRPPTPRSDDHQRPPYSESSKCASSQDRETSANLRKRNINQKSSKDQHSENSSNISKIAPTSEKDSSKRSSKENSPDRKFDEKNYCRNMLDKLTNDTKKVNEDGNERILTHNIYEEESDSSENNLPGKGEEKLINQTVTDKNIPNNKKIYKRKRKSKTISKKVVLKVVENKSENCCNNSDICQAESSSDSQSDNSMSLSPINVIDTCPMQQINANNNRPVDNSESQFSNLYPEIDHPLSNLESDLTESNSPSDEDVYKKELLETLQNDVQNSTESNSIMLSLEKAEKEESPESKLCEACEENSINARAYPCNHAYLCVDCAIRIFRIYKKCKICLGDVVEYVQFAP